MKITDVKRKEVMPNPFNLEARLIYNTEHAEAVHLTVKPGEKIKPHIMPVDVFFYILEGEPTVHIGDEEVNVSKDYLIEASSGTLRSITNEKDSPARVLIVKVPRPKEAPKFVE